MEAFRWDDGVIKARLGIEERIVLADVFAEVGSLLVDSDEDEPDDQRDLADIDPLDRLSRELDDAERPRDPALLRLLPDASRDDDELAAEFRRFTQSELRARKLSRLRMMWELVGSPGPEDDPDLLVIPDAAVDDVLAAMTDTRLVLAERLDVKNQEDSNVLYDLAANPDPDDPRTALAVVFGALGWWQETLLTAVLGTDG